VGQDSQVVGAVGEIHVGELVVTAMPLSQAEEMALDRALRKGAALAAGDPYTRARAALDAAKDSPADRLEMLREIARAAANGVRVTPETVYDYRTSPAGVALELYHRGRKATPGLTLAGLEAVVTEANCDAVSASLFDLIAGGPDEKKATP
jgi:hypothetical protein